MSGGLPQFDVSTFSSQLFWLAVIFVVLYLIIARALAPKIQGILETREGRIRHDLDRAASLKTEAAQAQSSYETGLKTARADAQKLLNDAMQSIKKTSEAKHSELEEQLARKIADSEKNIAAQVKTAMQNLVPVATDVTALVLERLLQKKVDSATIGAALEARGA
jgi:F-type H+-transporting ATPase subunit b